MQNPYIREENVIAQLCEIVDQLDIGEIGARHLIDKEITRYNKLRKTVLGSKEKDTSAAMDIKKYAKYLLEEGSMDEKCELLSHLKSKLILKDKKICLSPRQ